VDEDRLAIDVPDTRTSLLHVVLSATHEARLPGTLLIVEPAGNRAGVAALDQLNQG
jgi:hypothetical protein